MSVIVRKLAEDIAEARTRTCALIEDLSDAQLEVPFLATLNPLIWEACHAAYFQEFWVLRHATGQEPWRSDVDSLFDSIHIGHEERWRLPLPPRDVAMEYLHAVRDRVLAALESSHGENPDVLYYVAYSLAHEDMHTEALTYARQTLGYAKPDFSNCSTSPGQQARAATAGDGAIPTGDCEYSGGPFLLGAPRDIPFCHDNEKWEHPIHIAPFAMSRTAVSEGEFAAFVDDAGYSRPQLWSPVGWSWRLAENAELPIYWRRGSGGGFEQRCFNTWQPIDESRAACHLSWFEAEAYCNWAKRRLPTEPEWEYAASQSTGAAAGKPIYPWGDQTPRPSHANVDWSADGPVSVHAHADGDNGAGERQLIGNVWEWTSSTFGPYPDFVADMYSDYSQTSFATRKVLRGGCWATRGRMLRNTWRNYYTPGRRDVFAGLRTCALAT